MEFPASTLLEAILAGSRHPLLLLSRDGVVLELNRTALKLMEMSRDSVLGRPLRELTLWDGSRAAGSAPIENAFDFSIKGCVFSARPIPGSNLVLAEGQDQ